MFEIRNYEQKPIVVIRAATAQELAAYEKWKREKTEKLQQQTIKSKSVGGN